MTKPREPKEVFIKTDRRIMSVGSDIARYIDMDMFQPTSDIYLALGHSMKRKELRRV